MTDDKLRETFERLKRELPKLEKQLQPMITAALRAQGEVDNHSRIPPKSWDYDDAQPWHYKLEDLKTKALAAQGKFGPLDKRVVWTRNMVLALERYFETCEQVAQREKMHSATIGVAGYGPAMMIGNDLGKRRQDRDFRRAQIMRYISGIADAPKPEQAGWNAFA